MKRQEAAGDGRAGKRPTMVVRHSDPPADRCGNDDEEKLRP